MNRLFKVVTAAVVTAILAITFSAPTTQNGEALVKTVVTTTVAPTTTTIAPTTTLSDLGEFNAKERQGYLLQYEHGEVTASEFVNSLYFSYGNPFPALKTYEVVAKDIGWSPEKIQQWRRFVHAIMRKETHFCPNPRGGATWQNLGRGCKISRQGTGSDSGFGQVTREFFYAPGMPLCELHNLCDAETIVSTPYLSMASFLWTIEASGSRPWCYTKAQVKHKTFGCRFAPDSKYYDPDSSAINFVTDGE